MYKVTGLELKKTGTIIVTNTKHSVIEWTSKSTRKRTFYYKVDLRGQKYCHPYNLSQLEKDYWIDVITKSNIIKNGRNKNRKNI